MTAIEAVEKGRKERNASIDALRCLLMLLIVIHHVDAWGFGLHYSESFLLPFLFMTLIYWHVDGFIAISGWFGVRFSALRFLKLFGVVVFYSLIDSACRYWICGVPIWKAIHVSGGWYGGSYLALMFVAPFLNVALDALKDRLRSGYIWGLFMVGMILNWAPFHFFTGVCAEGGGSMSFLTFVTVYVNMRMIRLLALDRYFNMKVFLSVAAIFLLGICFFTLPWVFWELHAHGSVSQIVWMWGTTYNSPHCVLMAIAVFLLFEKYLRLPRWAAKICIGLSPFMFGVYMLHHIVWIGPHFLIPKLLERSIGFCGGSKILSVVLTGCLIFIVCALLDGCRHVLARPCVRLTRRFTGRFDEMVEKCI